MPLGAIGNAGILGCSEWQDTQCLSHASGGDVVKQLFAQPGANFGYVELIFRY